MNILIVGGSGLIGGTAAIHFAEQGHSVTILSRTKPTIEVLQNFEFIVADYINDEFEAHQFEGFDALFFSAAADIRHVPTDGSITIEDFYKKANERAVPAFFEVAKSAGIKKAVYIGTFYPEVAPQQIGVCPYVTSRHNADVAVRALADDEFQVCSLSAPFVLGHLPGLEVPHLDALIEYAKGNLAELPIFAPRGGTNHISANSLAQASLNALERGEGGRAYLVGDENYSWKEYLEIWFDAVGNKTNLEVRTDDHPMLPNIIMFAGVGATIAYEPDPADLSLLCYQRGQIKDHVYEIVESRS